MALTVTTPYKRAGRAIMRVASDPAAFDVPFTFVPSSSYTTSGDAIATADLPSGYTTMVSPWNSSPNLPYSFKIDVSGKLLLAYVGDLVTGAHEVSSTTNLQTVLGTGAITIWFRCV